MKIITNSAHARLPRGHRATALVDYDGRMLARKIVKAKACQLGDLLGRAAGEGCRSGVSPA